MMIGNSSRLVETSDWMKRLNPEPIDRLMNALTYAHIGWLGTLRGRELEQYLTTPFFLFYKKILSSVPEFGAHWNYRNDREFTIHLLPHSEDETDPKGSYHLHISLSYVSLELLATGRWGPGPLK